jgi:hypothetical protein
MKIADEIAEMTVMMESGDNPPSYQEVYNILLRAMLELRRQDHEMKVIKDKLNARSDY